MKFLANRKIFIQSNLKKPARVLLFVAVMILFCGFALLIEEAGFINQRTEKPLEKERRNQSKQNVIPFSKANLTPHFFQNEELISLKYLYKFGTQKVRPPSDTFFSPRLGSSLSETPR